MTSPDKTVVASRDSRFELLRILAMLAIVAGHFVSQSALATTALTDGARAVTVLLGSAPRIAVNVFLLIGCWFMVDAKFRPERIVRLYLTLALYTIPVTLVLFLLGEGGGLRPVVQGLLPFSGRSHWFISAYLTLMALTPFLNRAFELPRRRLELLVGLLFGFCCLASTLPSHTALDYVADAAWFPVVYLLVGWIRRRFTVLPGSRWAWLALGVILYLGFCAAALSSFRGLGRYWQDGIRSLPNFLCALGVFVFFAKTDLGVRRSINIAARSTLAIYILTGIPSLIHLEWDAFFRAPALATAAPAVLAAGIVGVSLAAFAIASLVDAVRLAFLEPRYLGTRPVRWLIKKIAALGHAPAGQGEIVT